MGLRSIFETPWKISNHIRRLLSYPKARLTFAFYAIPWGRGWRLFGTPIIQKHRRSQMRFGPGLELRSTVSSNPLGPTHAVILSTWRAGSCLEVGENFGMTGGSICVSERVTIGDNVVIGANSTVVDTDFHPLSVEARRLAPNDGQTAPVVIESDVFIGMNCLVLKGVTIGQGSVIGAGSVVAKSIPPRCIAAGNPARVIKEM